MADSNSGDNHAKRSREESAIAELKKLYNANKKDEKMNKLQRDLADKQDELARLEVLHEFANDQSKKVKGGEANYFIENTIYSCQKRQRRVEHDAKKLENEIKEYPICATINQGVDAINLPFRYKDEEEDLEESDYSDSEEE